MEDELKAFIRTKGEARTGAEMVEDITFCEGLLAVVLGHKPRTERDHAGESQGLSVLRREWERTRRRRTRDAGEGPPDR